MLFDDVYLVSKKLVTIPEQEITLLEQQLGVVLPCGYHAYMTRLGRGAYCDTIWGFPPDQIGAEYADAPDRYTSFGTNWLLSSAELRTAIPLAKTEEGDELFYCPAHPDRLFVLPRHDDNFYLIPEGFAALLHWVSIDGQEQQHPTFTYFEPFREDRKMRGVYADSIPMSLRELLHTLATHIPFSVAHELYEEDDDSKIAILFLPTIGGYLFMRQEWPDFARIDGAIAYDAEYEQEVIVLADCLRAWKFS